MALPALDRQTSDLASPTSSRHVTECLLDLRIRVFWICLCFWDGFGEVNFLSCWLFEVVVFLGCCYGFFFGGCVDFNWGVVVGFGGWQWVWIDGFQFFQVILLEKFLGSMVSMDQPID